MLSPLGRYSHYSFLPFKTYFKQPRVHTIFIFLKGIFFSRLGVLAHSFKYIKLRSILIYLGAVSLRIWVGNGATSFSAGIILQNI